jgi:DNA-3-methyladenine glycosylase II
MNETTPYDHLVSVDPVLGDLIARFGRPDPFHWGWTADRPDASAFRILLLQIVSQHVSTTRSFQLFERLERAAGGIEPARVLALDLSELTALGLPAQKAAAVVSLASAVTDRTLDLDDLPAEDAEAMGKLTALRGIGPWSAQMFLVGYAHRQDILPAGDFGIRRAVGTLWRLGIVPSAAEVARRGAAWSPYRSYAAALLWTSSLGPDAGQGESAGPPGSDQWLGKRAAARSVNDS